MFQRAATNNADTAGGRASKFELINMYNECYHNEGYLKAKYVYTLSVRLLVPFYS